MKRQAIESTVTSMLAANKQITSAQLVRAAVRRNDGYEVGLDLVKDVMKKDLRMGYRRARTVTVQANSERCLVLRQQFALRLLPLLESGRRIINVDESWLNQTRYQRRLWVPSDAPGSFTDKQVQPRISLLVALDTEGRIWCALTQANTDADVMTLFLRYLTRQLDLETPGWQESSTILLDNAAWHT